MDPLEQAKDLADKLNSNPDDETWYQPTPFPLKNGRYGIIGSRNGSPEEHHLTEDQLEVLELAAELIIT